MKASCASTTSPSTRRSSAIPAAYSAAATALRVAGSEARSARSRSEVESVAEPRPATRTGWGRAVRITAAAPSQIGEQSLRRSGVATGRFFARSNQAASGSGRPANAASGFSAPSAWARYISRESASPTRAPATPCRRRNTCDISAISAGMVAPKRRSTGSTVFDMISVATCVVTVFMRSPATTRTSSAAPERTL